MNMQMLADTACKLVADHKGLLAMDESNPTCNKRFAALGIPQTEEARLGHDSSTNTLIQRYRKLKEAS